MQMDPMQSVGFRVSQDAAGRLLGDPNGLRTLLALVETQQRALGIDIVTRIHLDIAEAMVDAHLEELTEPGLPPADAAALRTDPRCAVVVAALHYMATRDCRHRIAQQDEPDDLEILRWATDLVRGVCPVG